MNNIPKWTGLNKTIKRLWEKKLLYVVSNNKADQNYINIGCGIQSLYIPSLCLYTNEKYTGNINKLLIYNNEEIFPDNNRNAGGVQFYHYIDNLCENQNNLAIKIYAYELILRHKKRDPKVSFLLFSF